MKTGVILMTCLVPTKGHQYLVNFAKEFMGFGSTLHVIISVRNKEPTSFANRVNSFGFNSYETKFHLHSDDSAPQNPPEEDQETFWNYWRDVVRTFVPNPDFIFASEPYGANMASVLDAEFIPVDINRELFPIKGTDVRKDLFENQMDLMKTTRAVFHQNYVLFGQESTGKTTMAKALAQKFCGQFIHEWARPYLETIGHEPTIGRMLNIIRGQAAAEIGAKINETPLLTFYDTDLFSTIGFWKLYYPDHNIPKNLIQSARELSKGKTYIVMNPDIPFEKDVLRYGGNKRETSQKFWIDILNSFNLPYYMVQSTKHEDQLEEISEFILTKDHNGWNYKDIMTFERD